MDGSITFGLHHKIHILIQNGSFITEYYHRLNAPWKQFDAMIELPKCTCDSADDFKKHNQLMKLMQFLMGLNDSYMQISSLLPREVSPDVRSAYATISSEGSHRVATRSIVVGSSSSSGFTDEQLATLISLIKDNSVGKNMQANMVGHPNGIKAFISTIGNLRLPNGLVLYDVLVVPEYCVAFISVHKLAKDNKIFVAFDESRYPVLNVLRNILQIENKYQTEFCEICQKAKQNWEPFPLSDHTSSKLGDLMPNDDERVNLSLNSDHRSQSDSSHSSVPSRGVDTTDLLSNNSRNDADSSDDIFATQDEQVTTLEDNVFSEGDLDQNPSTSTLASKFSHWTDAMNIEMYALLRNSTWDIVDLPKDRKAIGSKWIFKIKYKSSGEIDRYNARLVAQGFCQKEGINYEKTFSLVKMVIVSCLLNIVVSNSWHMFQLDVNNAFFISDLVKTMYMKPPEGYFPSDNKVFSQSKSDYSLYTKSDKGVFLALLVYVDDIIITGSSISEIDKFKVFLKSRFMIKDLGKLKYFLGIEVIDTDKGICLNQRQYVLDLLSEYGMLACKHVKTPLMSKIAISNEATDDDPILDNITDYQKLMDKLICLTNTRPDISYVVHCLSQFMHSPLKSHLEIAFKILRYLKSCLGLGIHIVKNSGMSLKAFSDADWTKCVVTRKFVTGYCVFLMVLLFLEKARSRILSLSPQLKQRIDLLLQLPVK
ncbi:ribonuclease H-like domain-containing protein [Tanacetum coccineum]